MMHASTSQRSNPPSPPHPPTATASSRPPDPNALLLHLERAIAATEYAHASASSGKRQWAVTPTQAAPAGRFAGGAPSQPQSAAFNANSGTASARDKVGTDSRSEARIESGAAKMRDTGNAHLRAKPKIAWTASDLRHADLEDESASGLEVIHKKRSGSKAKAVASLPQASGVAVKNGRLGGGKCDTGVADPVIRAGASSLAGNEASLPASSISAAEGCLEKQVKTNAHMSAGQGLREGVGYQAQPQPQLKLVQLGDVEAADNAYRAGVAALERGDPARALEYLEKAQASCPPDRPAASAKIQLLIGQAHFELRLP